MLRLSNVLAEHTHLNADDRAWLLSLTHAGGMAMASAIALGPG